MKNNFLPVFTKLPPFTNFGLFTGLRISKALLIAPYLMMNIGLSAQGTAKITSATLGMMEARHIGPAVMGGRITAIEGVNKDPRIIYIGTAGGGVWKTTTACNQFKSIFDKYTQSIGALAIDQNHPDTVWVATGESNMRNSVSIGTGLYKTTDGGENWVKMGLDSSEHISRIVIDPTNSNIVYVAVPGHLWNDNSARGLFKTTDGGKTWEKILYIDAKTGCAEVLIDPKNPSTLYASTWQFRRTPYSFSSGGKGSGIYKSTDAGKTWKKIQTGLPAGEFGRVAMTLAPSDPKNLFAIVESEKTALYLSTNGGDSWKEQSSTSNVDARPFYFSTIVVDPLNAQHVYRPSFSFSSSDDGGLSFKEEGNSGGWVHSDMHALWINPNNTSHMLLGTDGGVYISLDRGNTWDYLNKIPVSMFYHVAIDDQLPYNIYGGLQDNGSWKVPSQCEGGIKNGDWRNVGGGDGFWVQPDGVNPNIVYSEYQGGKVSRINIKTNEANDIQPYPLAGEPKLRFNWNTPILRSPTNPKTLYIGAQYLYRSHNQGTTWEKISPDLTTNDPKKQKQEESGGLTVDNSSAENHCTIFSICESPLDENLIWVGTDDGNIQVTADAGKTWAKVNQNIKGFPASMWVSSIEPSRYNKNTVYVTLDNHTYGDPKTYLFRSTDLGKTWKSLVTSDIANVGYAHKIKEDIQEQKLLFLGTEMGLYASFDAGESWIQMNAKIPNAAVRDIQIHPGSNDLILATHGRGILIVDDISPLRQLSKEVIESEATVLPTRPALVTNASFGSGGFGNAGEFVGRNPNEEAVIIYYLKERATTGDLKVELFDKDGKFIYTLPGTKRKGLNKLTWNMHVKPPKVASGAKINYGGFVGPLVQPGTYTVKLTKGDKTFTGKIELILDPKSEHSAADRDLQFKTVTQLFKMQEDLAVLDKQLVNLKDSINVKVKSLNPGNTAPGNTKQGNSAQESLKKILSGYADKLDKLHKTLIATKEGTAITGEEKIGEKLTELFAGVSGYDGRPTDSQLDRTKGLDKEMQDAQKAADDLFTKELALINAELSKEKSPVLILPARGKF